MELLSLEDIASRRRSTPLRLGVIYFLFDNDELVYIGQTTNLDSRLVAHRSNKMFLFDSWSVLVVSDLDLTERVNLEERYIRKLRPPCNVQGTGVGSRYDRDMRREQAKLSTFIKKRAASLEQERIQREQLREGEAHPGSTQAIRQAWWDAFMLEQEQDRLQREQLYEDQMAFLELLTLRHSAAP